MRWRGVAYTVLVLLAGYYLQIGYSGIDASAQASDIEKKEIEVVGRFVSGKNKKNCDGMACVLKKDKDLSATICLADGRCFAASDETRFVQAFSISENVIKVEHRLYLKRTDEAQERKGDADEIDIEALATNNSGIFAVGSHSWKREGCERQSSRHGIFYFKPEIDSAHPRKPVISKSFSLDDVIRKTPQLAGHLDQPLQRNGLNIEGAAVYKDRLYLGFRAPYLESNVRKGYILSLDAKEVTEGRATKPDLHTLEFQHDGVGIRAMEPFGDGLLLLTGVAGAKQAKSGPEICSEEDSEHLENLAHLYYWRPGQKIPKLVMNVELPKKKWKAEGLMLDPDQSDDAGSVKIILFFDGPKNGKPHRYKVPRNLF
jgi:hypothetical protein